MLVLVSVVSVDGAVDGGTKVATGDNGCVGVVGTSAVMLTPRGHRECVLAIGAIVMDLGAATLQIDSGLWVAQRRCSNNVEARAK